MLKPTKVIQILFLLFTAFFARTCALECHAVAFSSDHQFSLGRNEDCNLYCNKNSMLSIFSRVLPLDDPCQGDDGFSSFTATIDQLSCDTGCQCRCSVHATAWRVYKSGKRYSRRTGWVSCNLEDYVARITGRTFIPVNGALHEYFSRGFVSKDEVHCDHQ
uniref:Avirulence protein AvrLm3 n=1 Tax=Leptosphaeria maculans TaxID=5022 RepID=A0A8K1F5G0_LEPMC|nr:avirulence protein AvrLm3 [Plenodomus lingam]QYU71274.1 avirulence protein AvrLm3 [Plenodomus lingam]